jgi:glycosyltransferase involved in cell wall biosynthesis
MVLRKQLTGLPITDREEPLVSIIMNCFNGEKYLREAVDSVLAQTYQNWELIFWDNQSTDESKSIFLSYDDARLKYYYAQTHTLLSEGRNYAIDRSYGDFIAFLDVDDWWDTNKLEKQMPLFKDKDIAIVYGNYWTDNEITQTHKIACKKKLPSGYILNNLLKRYVVGLLTIVIRRKALQNEPYIFNPHYHIVGDYDLVIRMAIDWKISCIQNPIAHYRWHGNNESTKRQLYTEEMEYLYYEMQKHPVISKMGGFKKKEIQIMYLKGVMWHSNHEYLKAIKIFITIPMCAEKLKLLFIFTMPMFIKEYIMRL